MTAPLRVLYVNHEVELGGAERSLLELLTGLDRARVSPELACSGSGPLAREADRLGVPVHDVAMRFRGKLRKAVGLWRAAARLGELIRERSIDLVHCNALIAGYAGLRAARVNGVPAIWHVRDIGYPAAARWACRRASGVIANSQATARALGFPGAIVIHNGVDGRFFAQGDSRAEVRRELGCPDDEALVGTVGRLDPWKGHRVLLAAAEILQGRPRTTFAIVGDVLFDGARARHGAYRAELEREAERLGLTERVHFLGQREDVPRLLGALDVLVHPSLEPEPFGRSVAEAQAVGVPAVASDLGGLPEIVTDGVNGFLVPSGEK